MFPALAEGEYTLTGTTKDGGKVRFCQGKSIVEQMPLSVTTELVIWSGHHYVSWGLADGDPNKTFNLIDKDVFATVKAGTVMAIHYSTNPEDTYHSCNPPPHGGQHCPEPTRLTWTEPEYTNSHSPGMCSA